MRLLIAAALVTFAALASSERSFAQEQTPPPPDTTSAAIPDTTSILRMGMLDAIVVTASRSEQRVKDAPAALTVFDEQMVRDLPATYYTDYLRLAAGVNAVEFSAGDQSIKPRGAAGILPLGLLTLIDNRAVYSDFNSQTFWQSFQFDRSEIKQIEVLRGPSSVVWGANAMDGVINIITKSPREMEGTYLKLAGGGVSGQDKQDGGSIYQVALTHAGVQGKIGYKLSGSYFEQDAYPRPTGTIPGTEGPGNPNGTPYRVYENQGSEQTKANARLDFYQSENTTWSLSGGYGGYKGLLATPIGPATMEDNHNSFVRADWKHKSMQATVYASYLMGVGGFAQFPTFRYEQHDQTYDAFFTDTRLVGGRHLLSYGVSARYAVYDFDAENRGSGGVYLQDEIHLSKKFRAVIGARLDYVDRMGSTVSPRVSVLYSPTPANTFRASYNRAFQAPTAVLNFSRFPDLEVVRFYYAPTDSTYTLLFPQFNTGNPDLEEEKLDNFEIGWVGEFAGRVEASASVYWNQRKNAFVWGVPVVTYDSSNPPPKWPDDLPESLLDDELAGIKALGIAMNLGEIDNRGVELGVGVQLGQPWTVFANYSWQDDPITENLPTATLPTGQEVTQINVPPAHRANVGVFWDIRRFFANANVNYQDEAFWADSGGPLFWGTTDSFALFNLGVGARVFEQRATISVTAQNVFDKAVQQHISSDLISRKVMAQITYQF